jgi:murein DD-endopeptidase MepM/ murein hydrolase activator NlpD
MAWKETTVHFIITDAWAAKTRSIHLSGTRLTMAFAAMSLALMLVAAGLYHLVFLKGARDGWPVVHSLLQLTVRGEFEQRDRFMRENIDAMARKLGEMQAKLVQLEALGDRVSGLAGVNTADLKAPAGRGGALVSGRPLSLDELQAALSELDQVAGSRVDVLTVIESRLLDQKIRTMMIPTQRPVAMGHVGSAFGWRIDPLTGRQALHTGLDFEANTGSAIMAASGGVVITQEMHPAYGNMVEVDHGNGIITRYGHASKVFVHRGDLVRRGQKLAEVGTTGRSTGPHLHFEVLVGGIPQDPQKFLDAGMKGAGAMHVAAAAMKTAPLARPLAVVSTPAPAATLAPSADELSDRAGR